MIFIYKNEKIQIRCARIGSEEMCNVRNSRLMVAFSDD